MNHALKFRTSVLLGLLLVTPMALAMSITQDEPPTEPAPESMGPSDFQEQASEPTSAQEIAAINFEKNLGQWPDEVLYRVNGVDSMTYITRSGLMMDLAEPLAMAFAEPFEANPDLNTTRSHVAVFMQFDGANPDVTTNEGTMLEEVSHYYIGESEDWTENVPHYESVVLQSLYAGIDLHYHASADGQLEYDFIVKPGSSPDSIALRFEGQDGLAIEPDGRLTIQTALGTLHHAAPYVYQHVGDQKLAVSSHYELDGATVTFAVGDYDETLPLVVDPLIYSTFIHDENHWITDLSVDSSGSAYISGIYASSGYPTTLGAYDTTWGGSDDGVVTKLTPTGDGLLFSTYFGGSGSDFVWGSAIDSAGNFYVSGSTTSSNFPVSTGAVQTTRVGDSDAFAIKFSAAGTLVFSTYLGGSGTETGYAIAADDSGNAYITGYTTSTNYPTTLGAYSSTGSFDGFLTKLASSGTTRIYSTYVPDVSDPVAIALDATGNAYLAAYNDRSVVKMDATGATVLYTYYGITSSTAFGSTVFRDIAVDPSGSAYVTGWTSSSSYPTTSGAFDRTLSGTDIVLTKLNPAGSGILYSTFIGGTGSDRGYSIALDSAASAYIGARVGSYDYPMTTNAYTTTPPAGGGVVVTHVNALGSGLAYSSYIGQSGDMGGIALQGLFTYIGANDGIAGTYPTTSGAYKTSCNSGSCSFVTKLTASGTPESPTGLGSSCGSPQGVSLSWTAPADGGFPISGYTIYRSPDGATFAPVGNTTTASYTDVPPYTTAAYTYKVTARNANGEGAPSDTTSKASCDSQPPTMSGSATMLPWSTTDPELPGTVSWRQTYSGLGTLEYSRGRTSGATDLLSWTSGMPQPDSGSTDSFAPQWIPGGSAEGTSCINVKATNINGATVTNNCVYTVRIDTTGPALPSVTSATHPLQTRYYQATTFTASVNTTDAGSGVAGIYHYLSPAGVSSCPSNLSTQPGATFASGNSTNPSYDGLGPFASYSFCLQAKDVVGNLATVASRTINVDAVTPRITAMQPTAGTRTEEVQSTVRFDFDDTDDGLDPTQKTGIDVSRIRLFIDDIDILAVWGEICSPSGATTLCRLEVDDAHVLYKPLVPWGLGNHTVRLDVADQSIEANLAQASTYFIHDQADSSSVTGDWDGDQVTDTQEHLICSVENAFWKADGTCNADNTDWLPPHLFGIQNDVDDRVEDVMEVIFP